MTRALLLLLSLVSVAAQAQDYKARPFCRGTDKVNGVYSDGAVRCSTDLRGDGGTVTNNYYLDGGVAGPSTEDSVHVGNGTAAPDEKVIPDCDGDDEFLQYDTTTNTFTCEERDFRPRRWTFIPISSSTTMMGVIPTPSSVAHNGTSSDVFDNGEYFKLMTSAASANATAGISGASTQFVHVGASLKYTVYLRTDSTIANRTFWTGLTTAGATTGARTPTVGTAASATDELTFSFDTAVSANWLACVSDNSVTCADTGIAVSTSTRYLLEIDVTDRTNAIFRINGTVGHTASSGLPTSTTALSWYHAVRTTNSTSVGLALAWAEVRAK